MSRDEYAVHLEEDIAMLEGWPDISVGPELALRIRAEFQKTDVAMAIHREAI